MTTVPNKEGNRQQFYKVTADVAKKLYKLKLIGAEAYIYMLVNAHRKQGWEWTFDPKDFCKQWEITKSTFYRAINSLKERCLIECRIQGTVTLCCPIDGTSPSVETETINDSPKLETETPMDCPKVETSSPKVETTCPMNETTVPMLGLENSESLADKEVESPTDITDIKTDNISVLISDNEEESAPTDDTPVGGVLLSASTVEVGFDLNAWKSQLLANKGKRKPKIGGVEAEQLRTQHIQFGFKRLEEGTVDISPVPE